MVLADPVAGHFLRAVELHPGKSLNPLRGLVKCSRFHTLYSDAHVDLQIDARIARWHRSKRDGADFRYRSALRAPIQGQGVAMSRNRLPRSPGPHTTPQEAPAKIQAAKHSALGDERSHVATLLVLSGLGWHVTKIRPDLAGDTAALWRVTIERYDGYVSITAVESDPDIALQELTRYAAADVRAEQ